MCVSCDFSICTTFWLTYWLLSISSLSFLPSLPALPIFFFSKLFCADGMLHSLHHPSPNVEVLVRIIENWASRPRARASGWVASTRWTADLSTATVGSTTVFSSRPPAASSYASQTPSRSSNTWHLSISLLTVSSYSSSFSLSLHCMRNWGLFLVDNF